MVTGNTGGQPLKASEDLQNSFVEDLLKDLLPKIQGIAPYNLTERKKGKHLGNDYLPGWETMAVEVARLLKLTYPDERPEAEKTYGTCLRQITAIKKALNGVAKTDLDDPALLNPVKTIAKNFGNALSFQFRQYKETQTQSYRETVTERRKPENRTEIDLSNALAYCHSTLMAIQNGSDDDTNWLDVSCAIALATGRRMAEVHLSANFEYIDDYSLIFSGQLKGKSRRVQDGGKKVKLRDAEFEIPTLINAELVCFGLDWLGDKGKRFELDVDPERVNRRFSKTLNQHCKQFDIFPDGDGERTYHKFRAAYFAACVANMGDALDPLDFIDYAKRILVDQDESTINSYKRYKIKPNSLTKI